MEQSDSDRVQRLYLVLTVNLRGVFPKLCIMSVTDLSGLGGKWTELAQDRVNGRLGY